MALSPITVPTPITKRPQSPSKSRSSPSPEKQPPTDWPRRSTSRTTPTVSSTIWCDCPKPMIPKDHCEESLFKSALRGCPASVGNGEQRSSVKIAERTYEEGTEAFHSRRKSSHPEAASCRLSASLGAV